MDSFGSGEAWPRPAGTVLEGIVGSIAYGLATDSSDTDRLGVFQVGTRKLLGLSWSSSKESRTFRKPDGAYHELGKFCRLALAANPTVLELLFLDSYMLITPIGAELVSLRDRFVSKRVRATYGGYARGELTRLLRAEGVSSEKVASARRKKGRHIRRLVLQLESLLSSGVIQVRLDDAQREECFSFGDLAERNPAELDAWLSSELTRLDALDSGLPDAPDFDAVERFLVATRLGAI